jgi:hypothetical protein
MKENSCISSGTLLENMKVQMTKRNSTITAIKGKKKKGNLGKVENLHSRRSIQNGRDW